MELLRANPDVDTVEFEDELLVRHCVSGDVHRLSSTAALLWPWFDGATTIHELAADVAEVFGLPHEHAVAQLTEFADSMVRRQLLVAGAPEAATATRTETTPQYLPAPPDP